MFKWTVGILIGLAFYAGIIFTVSEKFKTEPTVPDCKYNPGKCPVKVTVENCSGGTLNSKCEQELNAKPSP